MDRESDNLGPNFNDGGNENIYDSLAQHQASEAWVGRDLIATLQTWAERFDAEFKLEIPEVTLGIERLRISRIAHFRYGHNTFGLKGEVVFNTFYLTGQREEWETLGTLLHELLHAWQQAHGKPGKGNYHNRQFRDKALQYGLIIDQDGVTGYLAESRFKDLLRRYNINVPALEFRPTESRPQGMSKMKRWFCGCTNVRCAVQLRSRCLVCGGIFVRMV